MAGLKSRIHYFDFKKDLDALRGLHWIGQGAFKANGYQWEVRRSGDLKLGYWRKTLKARNLRSPYPKRFILIPGFGDTPLSWYPLLTLISPILHMNYDEILIFDFPGYNGFLAHEKCFPSIDSLIRAVNDTLDSLKPHTIFGFSLGGWLSAYYSALCGRGERPAANKLNYSGPSDLLLVAPGGIYSDASIKQNLEYVFKASVQPGFSILRTHFFAKEPIWFRWFIKSYTAFLHREDIIQFMDSVSQKADKDLNVLDMAHEIQSKVYILWGEKDTLIPSSCADEWLKKLSSHSHRSCQGILIRGVGHSPHVEKPAVFAAVVGQLLTQRTPHKIGRHWWTILNSELPQDELAE